MVNNKAVRFLFAACGCLLTTACIAQPQDDLHPQPQAAGIPPPHKAEFKKATHYHGINAPAGQLKDSLDQLEAKASAGDAKAAATLFAGLNQCISMNGATKVDFNNHCAGISQFDMDSAGKWLTVAAEGGNADAQYTYAAGGYEQVIGAIGSDAKSKTQLENYVATSRTYLINLAQQCNFDAIGEIAKDASTNGLLFGTDQETGYKYAVVESIISRDTTAGDWLVPKLEGKLTSQSHVPNLRRDAIQFVHQYCE